MDYKNSNKTFLGDVYGNFISNKVVGICNIPIVCLEEPKNGDVLTINECCQFELEGLAKVRKISTAKNSGIILKNNRISIDCQNLIKNCNLFTQSEEIPYFLKEGGELEDITIEGSLRLVKFFNNLGEMIVSDENGILSTRKIPPPIKVEVLDSKSNSDGSNINVPNYKIVLGINNVNNTTDLLKPISTATQTALNLKANVDGSNIVVNLFRENLFLNNVDNTLDLDKIISNATQASLSLKANTVGDNIFVAQFRDNLLINNVNNTTDLLKPISTATQTALNSKANDSNVVRLTTNQSISGLKTFERPIIGQRPIDGNDWATVQYIEEVTALTIFSNQLSQVNAYKTKMLNATGYEPNALKLYQYNLILARIANITGGVLPNLFLHPIFSFNLSAPLGTNFYNAGTFAGGDGNIFDSNVGEIITNNVIDTSTFIDNTYIITTFPNYNSNFTLLASVQPTSSLNRDIVGTGTTGGIKMNLRSTFKLRYTIRGVSDVVNSTNDFLTTEYNTLAIGQSATNAFSQVINSATSVRTSAPYVGYPNSIANLTLLRDANGGEFRGRVKYIMGFPVVLTQAQVQAIHLLTI